MNITKKEFIKAMRGAVIADERSGVENIWYEKNEGREWIVIRYLGGYERRIHADANSNGMNMLEIARRAETAGAEHTKENSRSQNEKST